MNALTFIAGFALGLLASLLRRKRPIPHASPPKPIEVFHTRGGRVEYLTGSEAERRLKEFEEALKPDLEYEKRLEADRKRASKALKREWATRETREAVAHMWDRILRWD